MACRDRRASVLPSLLKRHNLSRQQAFRTVGDVWLAGSTTPRWPSCWKRRPGQERNYDFRQQPRLRADLHRRGGKTDADEEWLNIFNPAFACHLLEGAIAESRVTRKPTADGHVTSTELFAADSCLECPAVRPAERRRTRAESVAQPDRRLNSEKGLAVYEKWLALIGALPLLGTLLRRRRKSSRSAATLPDCPYALGAASSLVARQHQPVTQAANTPDVSYLRQLNAEGIFVHAPHAGAGTVQAQPSLALKR